MSGYLLDGQWHEGWYDTAAIAGEFKRAQLIFRSMYIETAKNIYLAESDLHRRTIRCEGFLCVRVQITRS